jgi:hypothetical protein
MLSRVEETLAGHAARKRYPDELMARGVRLARQAVRPDPEACRRPDLVERDFTADAPDRL